MNIQVGSVVRATAGREKNRLFVATAVNGCRALISDGRERKLSRPKLKNVKHISPAGYAVDLNGLTDKKLRKQLAQIEDECKACGRQPLDGEVF